MGNVSVHIEGVRAFKKKEKEEEEDGIEET